MKHYPTIFRQLLDLIPRYKFDTFVDRYKGEFKSHKLSCWVQFTAILYGQIRHVNDGKVSKTFTIRSDSIYVFDRAYHDFKWYADINAKGAKFVARAKSDMSYSITGQHDIDPESDVISDEDIIVPWRHKAQQSLKPKYPKSRA